ncbi:MAG: hypothetical protein U9N43_03565 [Euryarchaeota archaeon]|nr:hypothetical protein [Euryarchaeota archaeon]
MLGALLCACTLALPVCNAADSPAANSGRGTMKASRGIRRGWGSMAVLVVFMAVYGTVTADNSKNLGIRGWVK